jgi:hypothetical protein
MKPNTKRKWIYVTAGLSALLLAPVGAVLSAPIAPCITRATMCDKTLLCAFKLELEEKVLLYKTVAAASSDAKNANAAKPRGTFQGIRYSTTLYNAALAEAQAVRPRLTGNALASKAYRNFVAKMRAMLPTKEAKYEDCSVLGVEPDETRRGTWDGMETSRSDCSIYGTPPAGSDDPILLDKFKETNEGCEEVWESDLGHERVHQNACYLRRNRMDTFQDYIDDDTNAYRYSVQHAVNDLTKMQIKCSTDPSTATFRQRADQLLKQAKQYQMIQASKP